MARIIKRQVKHGKPYEVRWSWWDDTANKRRFGQERFRTHAEAKGKKADLETKAVDGAITDHSGGKETVAVWAERWFRDNSPAVKPSTARGHRKMLNR